MNSIFVPNILNYTCTEQNCKISSFVLYRITISQTYSLVRMYKQLSPIAIGVAKLLRISINYLNKK